VYGRYTNAVRIEDFGVEGLSELTRIGWSASSGIQDLSLAMTLTYLTKSGRTRFASTIASRFGSK
jgi:hypothetical protein